MQITQKFPSSLSRQASKNAKRISVKKNQVKVVVKVIDL